MASPHPASHKIIGAKHLETCYTDRYAVRVVVFNPKNEVIIVHIQKGNYYKLPGGGIEGDEDHQLAAEREVLEEAGCRIIIEGSCVATMEEFRNDLHQISSCYRARLLENTGSPEPTEEERGEGLSHRWVLVEQALQLLLSAKPTSEMGMFINERDYFLLRECIK